MRRLRASHEFFCVIRIARAHGDSRNDRSQEDLPPGGPGDRSASWGDALRRQGRVRRHHGTVGLREEHDVFRSRRRWSRWRPWSWSWSRAGCRRAERSIWQSPKRSRKTDRFAPWASRAGASRRRSPEHETGQVIVHRVRFVPQRGGDQDGPDALGPTGSRQPVRGRCGRRSNDPRSSQ